MVDPRSLGLYVVAVNLSHLLTVAASPIAQVLMPRLAAAHSDADRRRDLGRAARGTVVASAAMAGVLVATGPLAIRVLFGAGFERSILPLLVLAPASAVLCVVTVVEDALYAFARPRSVLVAEAVGLAITVVGLVTTLRTMPLMGAALTSLASYLVVLLVLASSCRRAIGIPMSELLVPSRNDVAQLWSTIRRPLDVTGGLAR
jgi:O-antigen/teichoic acid export membrane protein